MSAPKRMSDDEFARFVHEFPEDADMRTVNMVLEARRARESEDAKDVLLARLSEALDVLLGHVMDTNGASVPVYVEMAQSALAAYREASDG